MGRIVKAKALDGTLVEFVDDIIGSGAMKDVYFSPDKSYVVALYKKPQDFQSRERVMMIAGKYREGIFNRAGGDYWERLFCWPTAVVEYDGRLGVVAPTYQKNFFFTYGSKNQDSILSIKGKEKEGKWFASASNRSRFLDPRELGTWLSHLQVCLQIARAVRRIHAAGLAHSDLSYKNVLVDPAGGVACVIDVDGLVVPGKYPPDVVGTPDFIAPEVVMTAALARDDKNKKLPSIETDRHALAVLIYMYLFYRHPLRGGKVHDIQDEQRDESLTMGEKALFVEHPTDKSNRIKKKNIRPSELPWADTDKIPYTSAGPYLMELFERAFMNGLHDPHARPTADEWEGALVKTMDLIQPCHNKSCSQGWYVFSNSLSPRCPFCDTPYRGMLPVLNLYSARKEGQFRSDNHRIMVWTGQSLFPWHVNRNISPNERLTEEQKKRVGYFVLHQGSWWLVNGGMLGMADVTDSDNRRPIPVNEKVQLRDGAKILLSNEEGGRLVVVQMVNGQ